MHPLGLLFVIVKCEMDTSSYDPSCTLFHLLLAFLFFIDSFFVSKIRGWMDDAKSDRPAGQTKHLST